MTDQTTPLRDRIAAALYERERPPREPAWVDAYPADREVFEAMAAAVLAVLPAPVDQAALREPLRRALAESDGFSYKSLEPHDYQKHVDAVLAVLPAPADRAAVLHDAADALGRMDYDTDSNDYGYDTYRDAWNGGVMDGAAELRRMADETAATETDGAQRLCGKDRGVSGLYYRPCARAAGHEEAYCRSVDGGQLFLAAPPLDPVHILGIDADDEPAAGACRPGCVACATDESHDPAPAAEARLDGAQR